jgi:signal transduction histidine kinase
MSIQKKVALLFFALNISVILLLSGAIFYFAHEFTFGDFYKRLEARVNISAQMYHLSDKDSLGVYKEIRQRYLEVLTNESHYMIKYNDYLKGSRLTAVPNQVLEDIIRQGNTRLKKNNTFYAGRLFNYPEGKVIFVVSAIDPYGFNELENLQRILIIGLVASLFIVYMIGRRFSYHAFKPVRNIIQKVNSITASNLHLRLESYDGKDEIAELTQTFNDMLNRLETAFETQNNFVSNASHELRTPLAIIKGEAELALKNINDPEIDQQKNIKEILRSAQSLQDILTSLLGMAQSGFDGKKQNWETIRADELVWHIKDTIDQINPENKLRIDLSELPAEVDHLIIEGNVNLLQLALNNISLNACKYSDNKPVVIKVLAENSSVVFSVKDEGIGIPQTEVQHIFEPFFRASNTGKYNGHGVGLPLTLNIVRLHKGSIAIQTKEGEGTDIRIMLPIYSR